MDCMGRRRQEQALGSHLLRLVYKACTNTYKQAEIMIFTYWTVGETKREDADDIDRWSSQVIWLDGILFEYRRST